MAGNVIKLEIRTVYQKEANGTYYFRYQLNGQCKAVSLKTGNQREAVAQTETLIPVGKAITTEIISAHVKYAKGLEVKKRPCGYWMRGTFMPNIPKEPPGYCQRKIVL